ncbi:hypothetical protein SEA_SKOG_217 [Gordonia phage Skog]|uniref:Uncharacterized protein n=1 Tax=Gordonia phage Skog TaxID=2704033 RepID=A0A6G6XJS9_9CAUD|nr:hypothetical protein KHQ85_gp217 [Gordonia phage Skog]QIG58369.1 hypothetical protein SEA_SKOG_217 [Gordonia phage Skog]
MANRGFARSSRGTFVARFGGVCPECDDDIVASHDVVLYNDDDEVVHEACVSGAIPVQRTLRRTRQSVCPDCNLDHAGSCEY